MAQCISVQMLSRAEYCDIKVIELQMITFQVCLLFMASFILKYALASAKMVLLGKNYPV